jgi:hypothetical protein
VDSNLRDPGVNLRKLLLLVAQTWKYNSLGDIFRNFSGTIPISVGISHHLSRSCCRPSSTQSTRLVIAQYRTKFLSYCTFLIYLNDLRRRRDCVLSWRRWAELHGGTKCHAQTGIRRVFSARQWRQSHSRGKCRQRRIQVFGAHRCAVSRRRDRHGRQRTPVTNMFKRLHGVGNIPSTTRIPPRA